MTIAPVPITPIPVPHGIYPLTLFDDMYTKSIIVMGWHVEGILDLDLHTLLTK